MSESRTVIEIDVKQKVAKLWRVYEVETRRWFRTRVEEVRDLVGVYTIGSHTINWSRALYKPGHLTVRVDGVDPLVMFDRKRNPLAGLD